MTAEELRKLLDGFGDLSVLVLGDYFLDRYLTLDPDLSEVSLETGLEARQVVDIRNSPGAAGTVTSNLSALGVGRVRALGVIGQDGHGYDLKVGLGATGVDTDALIELAERFTPTYTKPIVKTTGKEMERIDVKNREPLPPEVEARIIQALRDAIPSVHGVIALDQVQERNCGVITNAVQEELARLGRADRGTIVFADSRTRIGEFRDVIIKSNREEAALAVFPDGAAPLDEGRVQTCGRTLSQQSGKPAYITLGGDGVLCADGDALSLVPGIPATGPIDIVGAGDSVSAGVASALCAGASPIEAAMVGVLVSSITVQQIGATGTAQPEQVLRRFAETYPDGWAA